MCSEIAQSVNDEDECVIIKVKPYEPLYVKTKDGESSIPRRVLYDIVAAYMPYWREVFATFMRLLSIFAVITILFVIITMFQVCEK